MYISPTILFVLSSEWPYEQIRILTSEMKIRAYHLDHLERLCGDRGIFEHALGLVRREDHGYCTDDNARLLVIMTREPLDPVSRRLTRLALGFVLSSQAPDGQIFNRMDSNGAWIDSASTEDCWGRALWALGTAAAHHDDPWIRRRARLGFNHSVTQRSVWPRAMAFAALGAADVVASYPDHSTARSLLVDALSIIPPLGDDSRWPWPEGRLRYANAALAEAVLAAGAALEMPDEIERGLAMLRWLLNRETAGDVLSVVGASGSGPDDPVPQFDQQAIEVAALADACWRAFSITADQSWLGGVSAAGSWFEGKNDVGLPMFDRISGGGFDGLHEDRVNQNQGAESTLAYIATAQRVVAVTQSRMRGIMIEL